MIEEFAKEYISLEAIRTLHNQFVKFPEDSLNNRNAPFHKAFLKAFANKLEDKVSDVPIFISLSSWLHGLNTSLGQSFFEKTGQVLCNGEKRKFTKLKISKKQQIKISDIMADLKNRKGLPDMKKENKELLPDDGIADKEIANFTADVYFEDDDSITAIELKTVKPNSSVFKAEKEKILEAKAALKRLYPSKDIYYFLGFPFDPLAKTSTGYDKEKYYSYSVDFKTYIDKNEFLLAGELWNFLSGAENTMQIILDIINAIATTEFMDNYEFLYKQKENIKDEKEKYLELLDKWCLYREKKIVENYKKLQKLVSTDKKLLRIFNQKPFKSDIKYNENRATSLLNLL